MAKNLGSAFALELERFLYVNVLKDEVWIKKIDLVQPVLPVFPVNVFDSVFLQSDGENHNWVTIL